MGDSVYMILWTCLATYAKTGDYNAARWIRFLVEDGKSYMVVQGFIATNQE